jgi:hypothetical protein
MIKNKKISVLESMLRKYQKVDSDFKSSINQESIDIINI